MKRQNNNDNSENNIKKNAELLWNIALLLLILVWIGIAPEWYKWFAIKENGLILKSLYKILDGRWLVNIPLCICIIYGIIRWCCIIRKDHYFRCHRLLLVVLSIVILLYLGKNVTYAKIIWIIDYRMLILSLLIIILVLLAIKSICKLCKTVNKKKEKPTPTETKGFSDDNLDKKAPRILQDYANEIIERLLATNLSEQAFAVGITGEWGVGKTTFLNTLKDKIDKGAEVVTFNPWMCRTPEQVINDFFSSLRQQLSPKYSKLSRSIKEYAKFVSSLSVKPSSALPINFSLPVQQDSLFELKRTISKKFAELPHPVVVIIDDIDRLASEEVFEVLRLIRNTADLSNFIYLVAYDKDYVTTVLENKNIKNSTAYLEKIFQVEVHLPKVEDFQIWETLHKDINKQNNTPYDLENLLFSQFYQNEKILILRILDNYRRAKRFARLYTLNVEHLWNHFNRELRLLDIFWLELLQVYDKNVYSILTDEPTLLLYPDKGRFVLLDGINNLATENSQNKYSGNIIWKTNTPQLLELLFGKNKKAKIGSINYIENYSKYFTLSVSPFRLSISEMSQLFAKNAIPENVVKTWLKEKYIDSILFQFKQIPVKKLDSDKLDVFLYGILAFALYASYDVISKIKEMLKKEQYGNDQIMIAYSKIRVWFIQKTMMDDKTILKLSRMLNIFYLTQYYDESGNEEETSPLLISNIDIESMLINTMETYLDRHPNLTALDLLSEKGDLSNLFKNCCVNVKFSMNDCEYKQVAFDTVIEHFSKKENKPVAKEYEDAYGKLFSIEKPQFDNPLDEDAYWDYMSDQYYRNLQEHFGDSYNQKLEEFKTKCFD